jgi:diguanylate cyclase (GGDEF)-like protein
MTGRLAGQVAGTTEIRGNHTARIQSTVVRPLPMWRATAGTSAGPTAVRDANLDSPPSVTPWYRTTGFRYLAGASVLVIGILLAAAFSSYSALSRRKRLEIDRQEILEMVARREPLTEILQRLTRAVAENHNRAIGAAIHSGSDVLLHCPEPSLAPQLRSLMDTWGDADECLQHDLHVLGLQHGPVVPLGSVKPERPGKVIAIFPLGRTRSETDPAVLETLGGLAGVAIESARLHDQLAHQARHDTLTGLPNRQFVESELQTALGQARESGHTLALISLDLDRFKSVNDSLGHRAGDWVLGQVASRLTNALPEGSVAARVGGDEFTVILPLQTGKLAAERAAHLILQALKVPLIVEGKQFYPSASMGISLFPLDGQDAATLQRHADLAMYRAKSSGKDRYEFFSQDIGNSAAQAMVMEQLIRRALDEDWFEMFYQGQFNQAGDLAGMEALIRLRHPEIGLIGPGDFIPLAEETGLIHRLGEWVLEEVCRQILAWQDAGYGARKVSVNVSVVQFREPAFAESVRHILDKMQIAPQLIELELTESMIMGDHQDSARQMHKLRSLGVSMAVDDFGTGYSSLAYLHRLPIDVLKIDQSFVQEIDSPSSTRPLVQAIVALAHNLNLAVVAEGVETERQRQALAEIDCDYLQGYLLHKPQSAAEIEQNLFRRPSGGRLLAIAG